MFILISIIVGILSLFLFCSFKAAAKCDEIMDVIHLRDKK